MFEMFSIQHMVALAFAFIVFAAIVLSRKRLRVERGNRIFRLGIASLLIACEIALQTSYVLEGSWGAGSLPFQLCSLTLLLSAAALAFRIRQLYSIIYFLGTLGALQALATPNLDEAFPHFRYFHFFIAHIGIIASAVYLMTVERYKPTLRSAFGAWLWLHVLAVPAAIVNMATGTTNFMFLARKPASASLLDLLAPWPWYLLQLEAVAVLLCLILYGISQLAYWMNGRKTT
ncbi:TIGR02206 family membrane protein [Paenibacillus sp. 1011MAR3C5]|uniref:YwaF family protein n=1 Tax=Paenibacillus sp. 1011MAR3C5 TaxID=1675787 RepID=UPI000E6D493A|nr:TIGR02206 family membrane protein [Paenibacillus sp. 1011MAR3C5]RJE90801.1 TIGR02206 family membrane protein [Paenibacillus sp. 1011MAR3C5]